MQCLSPINIRGHLMPCGKCPNCMRNRQNDWVFRLNEEYKVSPYSYFITLTYRDADLRFACYVPDKMVFPCLSHDDIKLFFKRLRKNTKAKLKYHLCGEYGPNTFRPHYHALIFSQTKLDVIDIQKAWKHHDVLFNVFEPMYGSACAGYVTKYLTKKCFLPDFIMKSERCYRPFIQCSKGLGLTFIESNPQMYIVAKTMLQDYVVYDGRKQPMPRYYKYKIFTDEERNIMQLRNEEKISAKRESDYQEFLEKNHIDDCDEVRVNVYPAYRKMLYKDALRRQLKKYKQKNEKI